jgi:hypothetical protein
LRRAIQRYIENPLSVRLLRGDFKAGDMIVVDEVGGEITFNRQAQGLVDPFHPADIDALGSTPATPTGWN